MLRQKPIIVLLGATASGKTKLSIELAKRFNGEIISTDSMQVYKGLDITTAKATPHERATIKHHMLDVCDIHTRFSTIIHYRNEALPILERLLNNSKTPVLVGGTNYYIESLLWDSLIGGKEPTDHMTSEEIWKHFSNEAYDPSNPQKLYEIFKKIDPIYAQNPCRQQNSRKIRDALEIYIKTGQTFTELYAKQKVLPGSSEFGGPLRFQHVIGFWLNCEVKELHKRIDHRIDSMIAEGMLAEVRYLYNCLKVDGIDAERGIMQAIGFKEYLPYLNKYDDSSYDKEITEFICSRGGLSGQKKFIIKNRIWQALKLLEECLDKQREQTKRYSRDQLSWIRNRFLSDNGRLVPPIYELNTTNAAEDIWMEKIFGKAEHIIQSYIDNSQCNFQPIERLQRKEPQTFTCDVCNRPFLGEDLFKRHMQSRSHSKQLKMQQKLDKRNKKLAERRQKSRFYRFFDSFREFSRKIVTFLQIK